jgi:serine/threonine protein kinase
MDFFTGKGLSEASDTNGPGTDDFAGTPLYVAPEVFESQPRTKRSEIYSLDSCRVPGRFNPSPRSSRARSAWLERRTGWDPG